MKTWAQKQIQKITKCSDEQARYIEAMMRLSCSTLDGLSPAKFRSEAKSCLKELGSYSQDDLSTMDNLVHSYGL